MIIRIPDARTRKSRRDEKRSRARFRFAWLPTRITPGYMVWLERYTQRVDGGKVVRERCK